MPSIREVARRCGVAPMTVSLALNKPEKVSPQTRDMILQTVREVGYRPRAVRHRSRHDDPMTLGVLNTGYLLTPGYMAGIVRGVTDRAYALDQNMLLLPGHRWKADPLYNVRINCDGRCDGMIFISTPPTDSILGLVRERGVPVVMVGLCEEEPIVAGVDVDNFQGAFRATEHLIGLGHRRIAFLGTQFGFGSMHIRQKGYLQALTAHGLPAHPSLLLENMATVEEIHEGMRKLLSLPAHERPTAIFCWNDGWAMHASQIIAEFGLRVPEDISLVGFDDAPEAMTSSPALTTVRQPYADLGKQAVDLLLAQIAGAEIKTILLPGELIVRASTGPAPH